MTVVEVWPEIDEEDEMSYMFGPGPQPDRFLAFSEDLVSWTTTDLPQPDLDEEAFAYVSGLAGSGSQIALLMQIEAGGTDEFQVLFEQGIISEEDMESYCGGGFEGDDFVGYSCDYEMMEDELPTATTIAPADSPDEVAEEVVEAIEDEVMETELFRVSPGDPGYAELQEVYERYDNYEMPNPIVLTGTIGGEFTSTELEVNGWTSGITGLDQGFVVLVNDYESASGELFTSTDGVNWTSTGSIPGEGHGNGVVASGNRLVVVSHNYSETEGSSTAEAWVSDDFGATWTSSPIDSALFDGWGQPVAGPAGFAVQLEGPTEPYEYNDPFADAEPVRIEKDGYTMVMEFNTGIASLLGPDGSVIHDSIQPELVFDDGGTENIARLEGQYGSTIVWLDPETGEDLVSITEDDFNAAYEELFGNLPEEEYAEPETGYEVWFSADGVTWTLLDSGDRTYDGNEWSQVAGVGDDEVLVRSETWVETPMELYAFEEEGREPTDEEIEALDAWHAENAENNVSWSVIPVG